MAGETRRYTLARRFLRACGLNDHAVPRAFVRRVVAGAVQYIVLVPRRGQSFRGIRSEALECVQLAAAFLPASLLSGISTPRVMPVPP